MAKLKILKSHRNRGIGKPPGTLEFRGDQRLDVAHYRMIEFNTQEFSESTSESKFKHLPKPSLNQWYDIVGLHDTELIKQVGANFQLHPLTMEDILSTNQRAKVEVYDSYLYIVLRMILMDSETGRPNSEQVSMVLGEGWLITFQEKEGDVFELIRDRIRKGVGRIRKSGADYLAYSILDAVVDKYFLVLENFGDRAEDLEENLLVDQTSEHLVTMQGMKREILMLRKSIWPLREAINSLAKTENQFITDETRIYFRDAYDHTIQIIDTIESFRDIVSGVQDLYLSVVNNKMNEVMKMLALISTIFLPLTLLTGIYGMNFDSMPELRWDLGYPVLLLVMLSAGIGMYIYFKRRKWI